MSDVFDEFRTEQERSVELGYTPGHDDAEGLQHLCEEIVYRLSHPGETPTPQYLRHIFVAVGGLAGSAVKYLDRNYAEEMRQ